MEARSTSTRSPSANTRPWRRSPGWWPPPAAGTLSWSKPPVGEEGAPGQEALQGALDLDSVAQGEGERGHAAVHLQGQEGPVVRLVLLQGAPGLRSSGSRKARLKSTRVNSSSISRPEKPQAMSAPMSAPALVPVTLSTGIAQLLQPLDHADVGHSAGPAAAQHQGQGGPAGQLHPGGEAEHVVGGDHPHPDAVRRRRLARRQAGQAAAAASILLMLVVGKNGP